MKKIHIVLLILTIAAIAAMSFFIKDLTTHETFATAKEKGKFVVVKVSLDKTKPVEYDALKDPNLTVFYAVDKDGRQSKVVYTEAKPTDIERSEGLDLNGYMRDGYFECTKMQVKCPSKYKDEQQSAEKTTGATKTEYKY